MAKYLSRADLERIGGTVVETYYQTVSPAGIFPEPVDLVNLAKSILGLEVSYLPLSVDGSVLGIACFRETEIQLKSDEGKTRLVKLAGRDIVIDSSLMDEENVGRRNFTAAHELAHHILARLYPDEYRAGSRMRILYRRTGRIRSWEEWQADTMAATIIMPANTVRNCMDMFGLGEKPDRLSSACRLRQFDRFRDIAAYLGVSKKALAIRMKQLGLAGEEYLTCPVTPMDG